MRHARTHNIQLSGPTVHSLYCVIGIKLLEPPKDRHKCKICIFYSVNARNLQHNVSKKPSVKLDHFSLYDRPSSGYIYVKICLMSYSN